MMESLFALVIYFGFYKEGGATTVGYYNSVENCINAALSMTSINTTYKGWNNRCGTTLFEKDTDGNITSYRTGVDFWCVPVDKN
jgi:hypothetical protein